MSNYTHDDLRNASTLDEFAGIAERVHGSITTLGRDPTEQHRYRVITTDGVGEVDVPATDRPVVLRHWKAVTAHLTTGHSEPLSRLVGATVGGVQLECDPVVITALHDAGEIETPQRGNVAPWHPWTDR